MSKRILITGGAGFIGINLCKRLLNEGHRIIILDNFYTGNRDHLTFLSHPEMHQTIEANVCDPLDLEVDQIYHLACPASPVHYQRSAIETTRTCVLGTLNMLELAQRNQCSILQASTSEVYGNPNIHPQPESYWGNVNPIGIRSCYDEGKRCAESLCMDFHRQHKTRVWIARIFNTYGPYMDPKDGRVVSNFINQAIRNEPLTIYGDGSQTRSLCYVDDLVTGLIQLMNCEKPHHPGPYNMGNPEEMTVLEIAQSIIALTGSKSDIQFHPLPSDDPERRKPNIDRLNQYTGFQPSYTAQEGLIQTIRYFQKKWEKEGAPS